MEPSHAIFQDGRATVHFPLSQTRENLRIEVFKSFKKFTKIYKLLNYNCYCILINRDKIKLILNES
ncbi:hypothetical protein PL10110_300086 [Planktothrix agardhii]|nr:hypothetical protein PL10110_300086 [Planktothrix agardhii]